MQCRGWLIIYSDDRKIPMEIIGAVFARSGSKGIPKKNLTKLKGCSLVEISLKHLVDSKVCKEIYLCSDSEEILKVADKTSCLRFKRSKINCQDNSSELVAWREFTEFLIKKKNYQESDLLLIAPCTSPLRKISTLTGIVSLLKEKRDADGVVCIKNSHFMPDFNLLRKNSQNFLKTYSGVKRKINRQNSIPAFEMTTVSYCYKLSSIMKDLDLFELNTIGFDVSFPESLDIDTREDLELVEKFYK